MPVFLRICLVILGIVLFIGVAVLIYSYLKYEKHIIPTPKKIAISLPFSKENEAQWLIPMGETINHPKNKVTKGHPGIDFSWDSTVLLKVPIISVADGRVSQIKWENYGWTVEIVSDGYMTRYKELDSYNPDLKKGSSVSRGDFIGYPNHLAPPTGVDFHHYNIHWEFGYNTFFDFLPWVDRLCPMTYFDADAKRRIESIWDKTSSNANQNMKAKFPYICSGDYFGKDN